MPIQIEEEVQAAIPQSATAGGNGGDDEPPDGYVGPSFLPKKRQWKKGQKSPNPRGRPRKDRLALDMKKFAEKVLDRKIKVKREAGTEWISMAQAGIEQLITQFAKGDRHARKGVFDLCDKFGIDVVGAQRKAIEDALTNDHQAILDGYLARHLKEKSSEPKREFAPPDLRDDDVIVAPPRKPLSTEPAAKPVQPVRASRPFSPQQPVPSSHRPTPVAGASAAPGAAPTDRPRTADEIANLKQARWEKLQERNRQVEAHGRANSRRARSAERATDE